MKKIMHSTFLLLAMMMSVMSPQAAEKYVNTTLVEGSYEELLEAVKETIKGRGINIAHTLPAGDMLGRTASAFGITEQVFSHAETIEFCSAKISHRLAQANPENIILCPFTISVYVLKSDPKHVRLSFRQPFFMDDAASKEAATEMVALVKGIIDEVADW